MGMPQPSLGAAGLLVIVSMGLRFLYRYVARCGFGGKLKVCLPRPEDWLFWDSLLVSSVAFVLSRATQVVVSGGRIPSSIVSALFAVPLVGAVIALQAGYLLYQADGTIRGKTEVVIANAWGAALVVGTMMYLG
jgi:hypothetical protein